MKCQSCQAEIPPQWVDAIQSNRCPGCGGKLMDEGMEELLKDLTEKMKEMPNDPIGLAGWLVSNYKMIKVGDCEPTEFHRKAAVGGVVSGSDDDRMKEFFKGVDLEKIKEAGEKRKQKLQEFHKNLPKEDEPLEVSAEGELDEVDRMIFEGSGSPVSPEEIQKINEAVQGAGAVDKATEDYFKKLDMEKNFHQANIDNGIGFVKRSDR